MSKLLITGATGHLGAIVVNEIIKRQGADNVSVMVRNTSKAKELKKKGVQIVQGDYEDYTSLLNAFENIDKLYFVSGSDIVNRISQHENVVKAATETNVGHVIYTSFQRKTEDGTSPISFIASAHLLTDKLISESGLTYTILKHGLYTDVLPGFLGSKVLETGTVFLPAGKGKAAFATRHDMALAGVEILLGSGYENKVYEISGGESISLHDVARILTELSDKNIRYTSPDLETFHAELAKAGISEENIQGAAAFSQAIAQGEFDFPNKTLEKLIGKKPESVKGFLKQSFQL